MNQRFAVNLMTALAVVLVSLSPRDAAATSFAVDDFSTYAPGDINGQTGSAMGFSGAWSASPGGEFVVTANATLQVSTALGQNGAVQATHGTQSLNWLPNDGSFLYMSYRLHVPANADLNERQTGIYVSPASPPGGSVWAVGIDFGDFWVDGITTGGTVVASSDYLIVSRIQRSDAGDDPVVMWVDPVSEADVPLIAGSADILAPGNHFSGMAVHVEGASTDVLVIGDIRFGNTFADVVGGPPVTTTHTFTIYEDCAGHAPHDAMCPAQPAFCGDPEVLPFTLSQCVTSAVGSNNMSLDPDKAGQITRIEWSPNSPKRDVADAKKLAEAVKHGTERFDKAGCPRFAFQGATAYLPVDELDDMGDDTGSSYTVYFDLTDGGGTVAHASCNVAIHGTPKSDLELAARVAKDPSQAAVALPCAVCIGTGCSCPSPAQVCSSSITECTKKQAECSRHPAPPPPHAQDGPCGDYQRQCSNSNCSLP